MARLAESLVVLRDQVNAAWPNRNTASDGWIGDPAHQATPSDHNPNAQGVVCALDITNDPAGPTAQHLFDAILSAPQVDCKYIIANSQIASRARGWTVRTYTGDPHTSHIHVSVGVGPDGQSAPGTYDDPTPWYINPPGSTPVTTTEDKVLHLVKGSTSDQWWWTDWITKRYCQTPAEAAQIIVSTRSNGGKIECSSTNGPVTYDQATVDAVPVVK